MNIKACVFDIDGTLYDYRCQKIHDSTLQGVRTLQEEGILVIIASARSFAEMNREIQCDLKADYFIGASHSFTDPNSNYAMTRQPRLTEWLSKWIAKIS